MGRDECGGSRCDRTDSGFCDGDAEVSRARAVAGSGERAVGSKFQNVTKAFGDTLVVDDLSLEIADGEFVVLLGPSGCGKTTTLRMLAGLETITTGDVYIGGERINDVQTQHRDLAMVFQSYALYPHMTIAENIAYPLRVRKLDKPERTKRVTSVARMLEIESLLDRKPRQLSGGVRQCVALARAIVREPRAYLLDEPLSNLDARLRVQMRGELKRLQHQLGTTTIYVTHDQAEAMTLATRDRKSTRLNSSHLVISYAVFCLKKKKIQTQQYI